MLELHTVPNHCIVVARNSLFGILYKIVKNSELLVLFPISGRDIELLTCFENTVPPSVGPQELLCSFGYVLWRQLRSEFGAASYQRDITPIFS